MTATLCVGVWKVAYMWADRNVKTEVRFVSVCLDSCDEDDGSGGVEQDAGLRTRGSEREMGC